MKRFWKIFGITLGSVTGVALVAVLVVIYMVFTPKRLTPIVRGVVADYVACPHEVGEVDLTFFSTFPEFGLRIDGLYLINPMAGAQSDTVVAAPEVVAKIDLMKFLREKELDVHELSLHKAEANIFINGEGKTNIDVFVVPEDTTEDDTTAFSLPFDKLTVQALSLTSPCISFLDEKDSISATLLNTTLNADANGFEDINLSLKSDYASATLSGEQYADSLKLGITSSHTGFNLDSLRFTLRDAAVSINEFDIALKGVVAIPEDDILIDANVKTGEWYIPSVIQILPANITSLLKGIDIDAAKAQLTADVKGVYNDSMMPLIDASLTLTDGKAAYMEVFPYRISEINLNADAHVDLNEEKNSSVRVNKLHARTGKTSIDAEGNITELLDDMLCDVSARFDVNLPEFKRYMESDGINTDLQGRARGNAKAKIRLSDLSELRLAKGNISGNLELTDLHVTYDSILLDIPKTGLAFNIPNRQPARKQVGWISATLTPSLVKAEMIDLVKADLASTTIQLQASDVLSNSNMLYADVSLTTDNLRADLDSMGATIQQPLLTAAVDYNMKDTEQIPTVNAKLRFDDIEGYYTDIKAHLTKSELAAAMSPSSNRKQPKLHASLSTASLNATVGTDIKAQTAALSLTADAVRNPDKENVLLQWNPELKVDLNDGEAELASFAEKINIPQITFNYSNKIFNIKKSNILIGNSDFSLVGEVRNIGEWIDKTGNLEGELAFTSQHTDVNELMDLVSADSGTEETAEEAEAAKTAEDKDANPFLVPKDVDLTLTTDIREAVVFDQLARELGGRLYVKDGVLVLEEMGFICNAAKLQLTAIYKTPRRNHLYAGLDYHMVDINMQELVNMIPQIDTMMPMLRSFRGNGEFHLAAETFLTANYDPKWSTARGAVSITGKDLVLLDSETFGKIAKILMFNRKTENLVDSISVQATLFKKEIDIYPFCMTIDKYMAAAGGRHNLDMSFDYHISLLKPLYIGVDVLGTFDDLKIKPAKCRYAQDFRPIIRRDVETQNATLKKMINAALKRNSTIQSEQ